MAPLLSSVDNPDDSIAGMATMKPSAAPRKTIGTRVDTGVQQTVDAAMWFAKWLTLALLVLAAYSGAALHFLLQID